LAKSLGWTLLLVLTYAVPAMDLAAQQDPWTISIEVEGGGFLPTQSFGTNSSGTEDPNLLPLQPSAKAQSVAIFGGGIRLQLPNPTVSLRLSAYRTATGTVESRTAACDVLSASDPDALPLRERLHCDSPFVEDFTMSEVFARLQFKRLSEDGGRLRPTIDLGVGIRQYDFRGPACATNSTLLAEARFICDNADDLTVSQTRPLIMFGIGLEYLLTKFAVFARVQDQIALYGDGSTRGTKAQNDVLATVGLSFAVR
jgi:hypothetical protein